MHYHSNLKSHMTTNTTISTLYPWEVFQKGIYDTYLVAAGMSYVQYHPKIPWSLNA